MKGSLALSLSLLTACMIDTDGDVDDLDRDDIAVAEVGDETPEPGSGVPESGAGLPDMTISEDVRGILEALKGSGTWEVAAHQPDQPVDPMEFQPAGLGKTAGPEKSPAEDRVWFDAKNERYDALFVTGQGLVFGRKGGAPQFPEPTQENAYGGWKGEGKSSQVFEVAPSGSEPPSPGTAVVGDDGFTLQNDVTPQKGFIGTDWWNDDRLRVPSASQLTSYPFRVIGAMSGSGSTTSGSCSGAKVGPRAVLTASHCVMNGAGEISFRGRFNPGQSATSAFNGSIPWSGVFLRDWRIHRKYDYAIIFLQDSQSVVSLGWLGIVWWNSASGYLGKGTVNRGYPCGPTAPNGCGLVTSQRCKQSPYVSKLCGGWMYMDDGSIAFSDQVTNDDLLIFWEDVSWGHSGSPITTTTNNVLAVATHCPSAVYPNACAGPRFRPSMWNDVCSWIAAVPSAYATHPLCN